MGRSISQPRTFFARAFHSVGDALVPTIYDIGTIVLFAPNDPDFDERVKLLTNLLNLGMPVTDDQIADARNAGKLCCTQTGAAGSITEFTIIMPDGKRVLLLPLNARLISVSPIDGNAIVINPNATIANLAANDLRTVNVDSLAPTELTIADDSFRFEGTDPQGTVVKRLFADRGALPKLIESPFIEPINDAPEEVETICIRLGFSRLRLIMPPSA